MSHVDGNDHRGRAMVVFVAWGVGALLRKRWRGALIVLLGSSLFAIYVVLLGAAAYHLGTTEVVGTIVEPRDKARVLAEGISFFINTSVIGVALGALVAAMAFIRGRRAARKTQ